MTPSNCTEINSLLKDWRNGDSTACDKIFPHVYQELHKIAHRQLGKMWALDTLNTTALVHEAYLKLVNQSSVNWVDRAHFLAVSCTAIRQILLNYAEKKQAKKRGQNWQQITFDEAMASPVLQNDALLAVERGLKHLATVDERLGNLVEMRFYGGMNEEEIACVLGVTSRTVRRDWRKAKALLSQTLAEYSDDQS